MTKEELEKEAVTTVQWECTQMIDRPTFINGYITGAEPREKRIAELEGQVTRAFEVLEGKRKRIEELEKENAELKEKSKRQSKNYKCDVDKLLEENAELKESGSVICDRLSERIDETVELKNENIGLKNQLTKAKKIIKNLLILKNDQYGNTKMEWRVKVTEQAEQFLNSEVEK